MQGKTEERGPGTFGPLKMMIQQQYVRGTRWFGDYCCCCSSPAILPPGTRMYVPGSNLSVLRSLSASFTTCLTVMRGAAGGRQPAAGGEAPLVYY